MTIISDDPTDKKDQLAVGKYEENEDVRTRSMNGLISDAASNTGTHGVPHVIRAQSKARKLYWIIISCSGLCVMCWQIISVMTKFFEYPTTTSILYNHVTNLAFPAVTVCNLNPVVKSKMDRYKKNGLDINAYWDQIWGLWEVAGEAPWSENATEPESFDSWSSNDNSEDYYGWWYGSGSGSGAWDSSGFSDWQYGYDDSFENDHEYGDYSFSDYTQFEGEKEDEYEYVEDFLTYMANLPETDRALIGHYLEEMIITCTWQGKECQREQFLKFHNYLYGNCFTFNSGRRAPILRTGKEGPLFSLQLVINLNSDEYVPNIADGAGVRVVIHDQSVMPLPEEDGFNVRPGTKTSVEIKKVTTERATPPHGNCKTYTSEAIQDINAYAHREFRGIGFSTKSCLKTCEQRNILMQCHCFDFKIPYNRTIQAYAGIDDSNFMFACTNNTIPQRNTTDYGVNDPDIAMLNTDTAENGVNDTDITMPNTGTADNGVNDTDSAIDIIDIGVSETATSSFSANITGNNVSDPNSTVTSDGINLAESYKACLEKIARQFANGELQCLDNCPSPCSEDEFPYVISSATWPSKNSQPRILTQVSQKSKKLWNIFSADNWTQSHRTEWVRENLLKIEIYYKHFNHETVKTEPTYDLLSLISNLGGQCGLWLGLSMIALFEILELVADLIIIGIKKCKGRERHTRVNAF